MSNPIRIVVCLDIDAATPEEAYEKLFNAKMPFEWESTDEWFDANGEPLSEAAVVKARMSVLDRLGYLP